MVMTTTKTARAHELARAWLKRSAPVIVFEVKWFMRRHRQGLRMSQARHWKNSHWIFYA